MRKKYLFPITLFAMTVVFFGYFASWEWLHLIRSMLLEWAIILSALAMLMGVFYLFLVQWKSLSKEKGWQKLNNGVFLFSFLFTFLVLLIFGPSGQLSFQFFQLFIMPFEKAFLALLALIMLVFASNVLFIRKDGLAFVFWFSILIVLVNGLKVSQTFPMVKGISFWVQDVLTIGGMRGLLLGMVIGLLALCGRWLLRAERLQ